MQTRSRIKLSAATLTFALLNTTLPAYAMTFSDIANNNKTAIEYLAARGVIKGYADGTYKPGSTINRAELIKILVGGTTDSVPTVAEYNRCFSDVTDEWFAPFVCFAKAQGWVNGYGDGTFKPSDSVNKAEAIKMIVNSQLYALPQARQSAYSDVDASAWYAIYVQVAHDKNILETSDGILGIGRNMRRGSIAESIYRVLKMKETGQDRFGDANSASSSAQSSVSSSVSAIDTKKKYADGTYSATGNYEAPSGGESVLVTLTLKDDTVTNSTYQGTAQNGKSRMYQEVFGSGYKELVIGKKLDDIAMDVVSGSSLTPIGFMDAVAQIKTQAAGK